MALTYDSLDSLDFEQLCADIIGRVRGVQLSTFAQGRDGGIDAIEFQCEDPKQPSIIVQAKHYLHSPQTNLRNSISRDVQKLRKYALSSPSLYLMTSRDLTRNNKDELKSLALRAGFVNCEVWAQQDITSFLTNPVNDDVLRKHYKLWLTHTGILNEMFNRSIFIDCEYYLSTAKADVDRFVPTAVFYDALQTPEESRAVMLVGDPGTGKTILSEMLALNYAAQGYTVRYTTSPDVRDVMNSLSPDHYAQELIVLDDFLGENLLEVREKQVAAVYSLINHVKNMPNKRVILNSRISILNEAKRKDVSGRMVRGLESVPITDTNQLSDLEKARILLASIRCNSVPAEYVRSLMLRRIADSWYIDIVEHQNYNPRIVEYVCRREVYESVSSKDYPCKICSLLSNPSQVWQSEFDRLLPADRILLYVLYSMPRSASSTRSVRAAYERRIANESTIESTGSLFTSSISRLDRSLLRRVVEKDGSITLSAANPSINDCISGELRNADALCVQMINSANCLEQIERITNVNRSTMVKDAVLQLLTSHRLSTIPAVDQERCIVILDIMYNAQLFASEANSVAIANIDDCLSARDRFHHEPMTYVSGIVNHIDRDEPERSGVIPRAICEDSRIVRLLQNAMTLDDLGDLSYLYYLVRGERIAEAQRDLFAKRFDDLI